MKPSLEQVARKLVQSHRRDLPDLKRAILYRDHGGKELRLLEVVGSSPCAGEVQPFRFAPNPGLGLPYPTVLVELCPREYSQLGRKLHLPEGWDDPLTLFETK